MLKDKSLCSGPAHEQHAALVRKASKAQLSNGCRRLKAKDSWRRRLGVTAKAQRMRSISCGGASNPGPLSSPP